MPATTVVLNQGYALAPLYPGLACRTRVRLAPGLSLRRGTVLAEESPDSGVFTAYSPGGLGGTRVPKLLLEFDCVTDPAGGVFQAGARVAAARASAFWAGAFEAAEIVGLDAAAAASLGRFLQGGLGGGVFQLG